MSESFLLLSCFFLHAADCIRVLCLIFFFTQTTAYEVAVCLEFRRVPFRSGRPAARDFQLRPGERAGGVPRAGLQVPHDRADRKSDVEGKTGTTGGVGSATGRERVEIGEGDARVERAER